MKILHLSIIAILLAIILHSNQAFAQNETTPTIWFDQSSYATKEMSCYSYETGKVWGQEQIAATITITDQAANKYSTSIDRVTVYVWSDSDRKGIQITAYETGVNSGTFKGTVAITEGQSTQNLLHVSDGDTITAKYTGTTPWSIGIPNQGVTTTAFIGMSCPPLERVPASGINITDNEGNQQKTILVNKQIQIGSKLVNVTIRNQTFAYIVQISDEHQNVESISSVSGLLLPSQTFSPSVSWTPSKAGNYTVQIFVWQSIDNPNSLSPPLFSDITVWPSTSSYANYTIGNDKTSQCRPGYELVIRQSNNSAACVTLHTAQILVQRGWAKETISTKTNSIRDTSIIQLLLTTNSTVIKQGQTLDVDIWINNTSANKLTINYDENWPWKKLFLHPCVVGMPFGVALLEGSYSLQNLTAAKQLPLYQNGIYHCPMERYDKVNAYVFEPSSDNATLETPDGNFIDEVRYSLSVGGFYGDDGYQALANGRYTIVAADEWGHIAIRHFTAGNSTG